MSNWSRRPISSPVNPFVPVNTRKVLVEFLREEGYTLKTAKSRVGEWNESRDYYAVKGDREVWLDSVSPGDRPDWQGMWDYFQRSQPMFD